MTLAPLLLRDSELATVELLPNRLGRKKEKDKTKM